MGPYSIIEDGVQIGDGSSIGNYTIIKSGTTIGPRTTIFHHCSVGEVPQDQKYGGEETTLRIGEQVTIREAVTINRGTAACGVTTVGNQVLLMAYTHIAHDCSVGDNAIMANQATLGGHVEVGAWATLGGGVLIHQFCRIGEHAFIGGGYRVAQDVPPYILASGEPLRYGGINRVGLERRGFTAPTRQAIKQAYRWYFRSPLTRTAALEKIRAENSPLPEVDRIVNFITSSQRGII